MALDPSLLGRSTPPESYLVGREKIREFADAIGADDGAYHDPAAAAALGYPDVVAPPTFPALLSMAGDRALLGDPAVGIELARVLHGDERFLYTRPIHAGDRLTYVTTIAEMMSRAGSDFLTTRTDVTTETGHPVVTVYSRVVVRGEG
jgi:acyl dehydratase